MTKRDPATYFRNMTYAAMAGQSGCVSVILILGSLFLGLWLDSVLDTRPAFTLVLILLSIPLSLVTMVYMVLGATNRITPPDIEAKETNSYEEEGGRPL